MKQTKRSQADSPREGFVNLDRVTRIGWLLGKSSMAVPTPDFYFGGGDPSVTVHNDLAIEAKQFLTVYVNRTVEEV